MFCTYPYAQLRQLVSEVIRRFGADRVMWGSNFPVCGDEDAYIRELQLISTEWASNYDQMQKILGRTANDLWFSNK
jgi:predicted TIM-barrel fold metal-dependent hydrolase